MDTMLKIPSTSSTLLCRALPAQGKSLQDSLLHFYESGSHTDIIIHVRWRGETVEFRAHKLILALRSPVFANEFRGKESFNLITFVVEGVHPQLIRHLLWYFYTDDLIAESPQEVIGFAKVAKYYQVGSVEFLCKQVLSCYVVEERNVWGLLEAALFFNMEQLSHTCLEIIRNDLKRMLSKPEFLSIHEDTLAILEKEFAQHLTRNETLEVLLRWLQCNKRADRSVLSNYDIASLSIDEFLDLQESYPSFISAKDALAILASKLRRNVMELPSWYNSESKSAATEVSGEINIATLADRSLRLKASFKEQLSRSFLFGTSGFSCASTIQLKLDREFPQGWKVIMFELAFGSSFVPEDNLDIKLFSYRYGMKTIQKKQVKFSLHPTPDNYYIICKELCYLDKIVPQIYTFHLEAKELRRWREEPLPDNRYRVMQIPEKNIFKTSLSVGANKIASLTTLSDWLAFVDPNAGTKNFLLTALYLEKE